MATGPQIGGIRGNCGCQSGECPQPNLAAVPRMRQLKWLLLRAPADLSDEEYTLVQRLFHQSGGMTVAYGLVMDFQL